MCVERQYVINFPIKPNPIRKLLRNDYFLRSHSEILRFLSIEKYLFRSKGFQILGLLFVCVLGLHKKQVFFE